MWSHSVTDGFGMEVNLRMAADSTMLRIVNRLMALSFGVHLEQLEQRIGLTWPRPFLFRPLRFVRGESALAGLIADLEARFLTILADFRSSKGLRVSDVC